MPDPFDEAALDYHATPTPGKLAIATTKPMDTQRDLSLAYTPGVAAACKAIVADPHQAAMLTARQNLVGIVTNGSAVLGLGDIGPLAAKPVMEGKAALFKKFAGIDGFGIEIDERDAEEFVRTVARLAPTFGGINLEDIKAPECFVIEQALRERMQIPVFHDDQHGTAIIVAAAILNGLRVVGKPLERVRLVVAGAGAAALASLNLLTDLGLRREHVLVADSAGVIHQGRSEALNPWKAEYAAATEARTLAEALEGADIFLGLSVPEVVTPDMVERMAERPLILALAEPRPEIRPELVRSVRPDAILATASAEYPNQINSVLCFPYLFRGVLDVGATTINPAMTLACVHAIADLAQAESSDAVMRAYGDQLLRFGPDYLIPKPFDPRLILRIAPAVARAAMDSGVATRPIEDMDAYVERLTAFVYGSSSVMRPLFEKAKRGPKRLVYAEGEEHKVLQAAQQVVDEGIAFPLLVGRPEIIAQRIEQLGLRLEPGRDCEIVNPLEDERYAESCALLHQRAGRLGVSVQESRTLVRTDATVVAALMVQRGAADAMLCGTVGRFQRHLERVRQVIGLRHGVSDFSTVTALILPTGTYFLCDTHVTPDPSEAQIVEMTLLASAEVRAFGLTPQVALLSRSHFGTHNSPSACKMRGALHRLQEVAPDLIVEGEMNGETAVSEELRQTFFGESVLKGPANLLIMPNDDAAHIAYSLLKVLGGGVAVGPILLGVAKPAHIVTQTTGVRGLVNMSAIAVAEAQMGARKRAPLQARTV
ncbi:NADP-dependent malic enzyme [Halomonas sp. BM-2019]|uniref:NADP-dependent malic enzyme n=1 Tax=Halomonas sp. BM-2019 TaxID=2811227 RepID=UPI001B3C269B|nr:MAG: NADP-dependent malic enzyme [Halomonas sp. BM-2019]